MTLAPERPTVATPVRRGRNLAPIFIVGFAVLVAVDLLVTGLTSPPAIVPPLELSENTGVPVVPTNADFPYDRTHNMVTITLFAILGTAGLFVSLREGLRNRNWVPLFMSFGTVAIIVPEVFVDVIGMVYYPTDAGDHAFDLFGRQMGWFVVAGWFGAGAFAGMVVKALDARPTAKQVWLLVLGTGLSYTIFEELMVGFGGIYHYYGNQPMWWFSLPLWWTPCNTIGAALLPAAFAYRYREAMRGWRACVMVVVVPASVAGSYAFIAMPSWIVVNGDYPWLPTELAGLATWGLGIGLVAVILNLFMGYRPFDAESRPGDVSAGA